jgi:hypothetical protein
MDISAQNPSTQAQYQQAPVKVPQPAVPTTPTPNFQEPQGPSKIKLFVIFILILGVILSAGLTSLVFFNVIDLSSIFSSEKTLTEDIPEQINPAEKVPYEVLRKVDDDYVGRRLLYKGRILVDAPERVVTEGMGYYITTAGNTRKKIGGTGLFQRFEKIEGSKDRYAVITMEGVNQKFRIVFERPEGPDATPSSKTRLWVEDLNILVKEKSEGVSSITDIASIDEEDFNRIFMPYDAVSVLFRQAYSGDFEFDNDNIPVASHLIIRRFGGVDEVIKEALHVIYTQPVIAQ